ncbi:MAG: IclR family transcriptional regulator [Deltaproteobacteria bacterium]|nr:IclR family transcriptional regulator [Deltaproteobacteria bacterium]MBW1911185.1 IclR family transcriptional regulator [Deltaproteobacteria bacterium]MBW2034416.1 IclR family transcriptional regulator [Deltaproteobacteria bacterium]MBW2168033.1 IclR family transcriptional regulator [Deltaproteobacteria bacterium]
MKRYGAPSVKKAFEILGALSSSKEGLGVSEIARGLNMAKSTVHGMTSALEELGAVMRDPHTKKYRLGFTLFELGRSAYSQIDLKTLARPIMEELMEETQASVFLGILNWDHVTVLDIVESRQDLKITAPIGTTIPLFAGAVGKVFLAWMEEEQTEKIIRSRGLTRFTENTIVDPELYYQELMRVRKMGYAVDDEEYILGVRAVASPIVGLGQLMSAIWVVGFKASLDEKKMKTIIRETKKAAEAIRRGIQEQPLN